MPRKKRNARQPRNTQAEPGIIMHHNLPEMSIREIEQRRVRWNERHPDDKIMSYGKYLARCAAEGRVL